MMCMEHIIICLVYLRNLIFFASSSTTRLFRMLYKVVVFGAVSACIHGCSGIAGSPQPPPDSKGPLKLQRSVQESTSSNHNFHMDLPLDNDGNHGRTIIRSEKQSASPRSSPKANKKPKERADELSEDSDGDEDNSGSMFSRVSKAYSGTKNYLFGSKKPNGTDESHGSANRRKYDADDDEVSESRFTRAKNYLLGSKKDGKRSL